NISPHSSVWITLALVAAASIPMLAGSTNFVDDWAWIWVMHYQGARSLPELHLQAAHPGFAPGYLLLFWIDGDAPGIPGRFIAVACHLANGWLVWLIFLRGRATTVIAASIAVLYLVSPFLGGVRAAYDHTVYDVYIFCYLGSIVLCDRKNV